MSRIVEAKVITKGAGKLTAGEPKEYLERIAKYIPAEIVAAYLAANGFAESAPDSRKLALFALIFLVCLACTPWYITRFGETRKAKIVNALVASAAFVVWSYALGGVFKQLGWHEPTTASVILILFSLISGRIQPTIVEKPPQAG